MAKIKNPIIFSEQFKIDKKVLVDEGLFDPILNVDTLLFIDPLLLAKSNNKNISLNATQQYRKHFQNVLKLLRHSKKNDDEAWKAARKLLTIKEVQGTSLGYGVGSTNGRNLPKSIIEKIVNIAKEIVDIGIEDPELFALLPLLQDGIGPDFISDFTTIIIEKELIDLTNDFANKYSLPLEKYEHDTYGQINCLLNPLYNIPILLIPKDILGKLPTASDWSGVIEAADFSASLKRRVNFLISNIWAKRANSDKNSFKNELIRNKDDFLELIDVLKSLNPKPYDFNRDEKGVIFWHDWLKKAASDYPIEFEKIDSTKDGLVVCVEKIISQFKFLIEKHGLNKILWNGDRRAPEKVSQMLFFSIAYSYVKANNIDINAEIDAGTGLIDFKFSTGFNKRIIVELKLTSNPNIVSGYLKQLEIYKESEETSYGYYIVMNVGAVGKKLKSLERIEDDSLSKITIVDGRKRPSASKVK